jgi:cytochrome c oxidase cbb3-type subunit 3/ubiquinol-cytochrome c reductase cytochrome c subunit
MKAPGKPGPNDVAPRPGQVHDFGTLYKQNCAACHGESGRQGAAVSLGNPVYLDFAGVDNLARITARGVPHTLMPAFSQSAGGTLTEEQIVILAHGMVQAWGDPTSMAGQHAPGYVSVLKGDPANGQKAFQSYCARCHGSDGQGVRSAKLHTGSLTDPAYLALVSDQSLRSTIIAGRPADQMPDWRFDAVFPEAHPMTDQDITDTVAWLAAHRSATPGQPYSQHP